jgi:hypothetical protein
MIKKYLEFITEDANDEIGIKSMDSGNYTDITDEVNSMIKKTIEASGGEYKSFLASFIQNSEDVKVDGFKNDSDIYEFYLKFRNDIDEILNNIRFFDTPSTELNAYGLYEYVIKGTERAFSEVVKMIK